MTARKFDYRKLMQLAIDEMKKSISEPRKDGKASPKVGVVLISEDGAILGSAFRGEMRNGDHAEYTLLDRKFRDKDVTGCYLFASLEPCAPGSRNHPKLGCAERIVNARIKKVWVGIEDPDPKVDRKGIKYLMDAGIEVEMFDQDFQDIIYKENKDFFEQAKQRKEEAQRSKTIQLTHLEEIIETATINEFSKDALELYINRSGMSMKSDSQEFLSILEEKEFIQYEYRVGNSEPSIENDEFRRNDVMPLLVWSSGSISDGVIRDKFKNNGDRANIVSFREFDDNSSIISLGMGRIEHGQEWSITATNKLGEINGNLLGYHIEIFYQDKDNRNYRQEFIRKGIQEPTIMEAQLITALQDRYRPSGLGILLFGKKPRTRFPQAVFKVEARY